MSPTTRQLLSIGCLLWQLCTLLPYTHSYSTDTANVGVAETAYCDVNETYTVQVPVTKTRLVEKKPTGFFKFAKKSKTQVEQYVDMVPEQRVRLISGCCAGYRMSDIRICEPICEHGCPTHAFCKEPNLCQCRRGYVALRHGEGANATHHCEPLCEPNCPAHARCIAPGVCECERGYYQPRLVPHLHQCLPRCASSCALPGGSCVAPETCECAEGFTPQEEGCAPVCDVACVNGRCVAPNQCACNADYAREQATGECVPAADCGIDGVICAATDDWQTTTAATDYALDDTSLLYELDAVTGSGDVALQSRFAVNENAEDGSGAEYSGSGSGSGDDELFPSSVADCALQPCAEDAVCKLSDRCACAEGFVWHQPSPMNGVEVAPICAALIADQAAERSGGWLGAFFIAVGVALMVGALAVLLVKLLRRHRGNMDVGGKNDLCCKYDNRGSISDSDRVVV